MNPRQGPQGRMHHIREASWGADPTTPNAHLVPFITDGFNLRQPRTRGIWYDGTFTSKGSYKELIDSSGPVTTSLDYHYVGIDLMDILGSTGYTRVGGYHKWVGMGAVLPHQIRKEFTQATAIIHRYPGVVATMMKFAQVVSGQQQYEMTRLGQGSESSSEIAGTVLVDNTIKDSNSYFDGALTLDGAVIANGSEFDFTVDRHITRKEGVFFNGQAAAFNSGIPEISGNLGKIFSTEDGDTFYAQALNDTVVGMTCLYANNPMAGAATMWLRFSMDAVLFDRTAPPVGGEVIPDQVQGFRAQVPAGYHAASAVGSVSAATFNVTGTNNVVSVKFEGGATINVTLTTGAARTMQQIVDQLNLDAPFTADGTAVNLGGRLEIVSKDVTVSSSVQWQTGTANSAHTLLGHTTTIYTSTAPADIVVELYNDLSADYV